MQVTSNHLMSSTTARRLVLAIAAVLLILPVASVQGVQAGYTSAWLPGLLAVSAYLVFGFLMVELYRRRGDLIRAEPARSWWWVAGTFVRDVLAIHGAMHVARYLIG